MSVPYRIVSCSACKLSQFSTILNGYFVWRDPEYREYDIDRELAVCRGCNGIVPKEKFPNQDLFQKAKEIYYASFFKRKFLAARTRQDDYGSSLINKAIRREERFEVLEAVMGLRRRPVCLSCGSANVSAIPIPDNHDVRSEKFHRTSMMHPGCGGELLVRGSGGERIAVHLYKRTYDIRGNLVKVTEA